MKWTNTNPKKDGIYFYRVVMTTGLSTLRTLYMKKPKIIYIRVIDGVVRSSLYPGVVPTDQTLEHFTSQLLLVGGGEIQWSSEPIAYPEEV